MCPWPGARNIPSHARGRARTWCAKIYPVPPGKGKTKMTPCWVPYIAVANVDRAVKKATAAGAMLGYGPLEALKAGQLGRPRRSDRGAVHRSSGRRASIVAPKGAGGARPPSAGTILAHRTGPRPADFIRRCSAGNSRPRTSAATPTTSSSSVGRGSVACGWPSPCPKHLPGSGSPIGLSRAAPGRWRRPRSASAGKVILGARSPSRTPAPFAIVRRSVCKAPTSASWEPLV